MTTGSVEVLREGSVQRVKLHQPMTVQELMDRLAIQDSDGYWVACNRKAIRKSERTRKILQPDDRVEIFRVLSGGSLG
jgi:thiamine biosynthesis protein ThiS